MTDPIIEEVEEAIAARVETEIKPTDFKFHVAKLVKSGTDIIGSLTPTKAHLIHMVVGVSGEAGELLDAIKKHAIYNKELDRENVIEELGDIEFYLEGIRAALNIHRNSTLKHNIKKLGKRYGVSYSDQKAQARADKGGTVDE
jgi:NTP pyrophosphatase (non-canonical NTP hydrolase)